MNEIEAVVPHYAALRRGAPLPLPGLLGSSLCETYELERLFAFLLDAMAEKGDHAISLPAEQVAFLQQVAQALEVWNDSTDPDRDYQYWDIGATARETYRQRVGSALKVEPLP